MQNTSNNMKGGLEMTSCVNAKENISAYIDNELKIYERLSYEDHVRSCKECKSELDELRRVADLCTMIPQRELPADFKAELHEKLLAVAGRQQSNIRSVKKFKSFLFTKTFASVAASMLLIILAGSFYKLGLFSPVKSQDRANSTAMAAEQPAAMIKAESSVFGANNDEDIAESAKEEAKSFSSSSAEDASSIDMGRSETVQDRVGALASGSDQMLMMETANSRFSTITITIDNPEIQIDKLTALVLENNGDTVDMPAYSTDNVTTYSKEQKTAIKSGTAGSITDAPVNTELNFFIPATQYDEFIKAINAAFGETNIQTGALVTEDMTDALNTSIARVSEIENQIRELNEKDSVRNAGGIKELKTEKAVTISQIEKIRFEADFINVAVFLNKK